MGDSHTLDGPIFPRPCVLPPPRPRKPSVIVERTEFEEESKDTFDDLDGPYKSVSQSSSESMPPFNTTTSPSDLEKAGLARETEQHSANNSRRSSRQHRHHDHHSPRTSTLKLYSEKPLRSTRNSTNGPYPVDPSSLQPVMLPWNDASSTCSASARARQEQETKTVSILLHLSGPAVLLSLLNAFWCLLALFITCLTQPVRICARRPTISQQLAGLLGPSLNLQLRSIHTPLPPHADEDASYYGGYLVAEHLLSPIVSLAVMLSAWVLAVYWVSSAVVGDPAGQDKRDDGREAVLGLRGWWERWLTRCVKDEP